MPSNLEPLTEPDLPAFSPDATKVSMNDSEVTSPTDVGSVSEEESGGNGWLGNFARSIKDNVPAAIGGFANLVHRSAMTVAAEIAQLERDAEHEAERWREENYGDAHREGFESELRLPWEVESKSIKDSSKVKYKEDSVLKEKIFALSKRESTFRGPYDVSSGPTDDITSPEFSLDEPHICLIRRMLELDENLAAMHAKLSGRSDVKEAVFWRNFFYHCERLQRDHAAENGLSLAALQSPLADSLGSLVPADSVHGDDTSYVNVRNGLASAPSSMNTVSDTMSVGDMVVIGANRIDLADFVPCEED